MNPMSVGTISDLQSVVGPFNAADVVIVDGHSVPGDQGGGSFYFDPLPTGSGGARGDSGIVIPSLTQSGMWRRIYSGGINVCWFGALAKEGVDNFQAFQKALDFIDSLSDPGNPAGTTLLVPFGNYEISKTLVIKRHMILQGMSGGGRYSGTMLNFTEVVDGIVVERSIVGNENTVIEGGAWTVIRDLGITCTGKPIADSSISDDQTGLTGGHGIVLKGRARIVDCQIEGFAYDGVHIETGKGENANNFEVHNSRLVNNGRHGMFTKGNDSNAGRVFGTDCSANKAWGVYEASFLGNTYVGCHCAGNKKGGYKAVSDTGCNVFVGCYAEVDQINEFVKPSLVLGGTMPRFTSNGGVISVNSILGFLVKSPIVHAIRTINRSSVLAPTSFGQDSLTGDDEVIFVDLSAGRMQLILPPPGAHVGHKFVVRRINDPSQNPWVLWIKTQDRRNVERDWVLQLTQPNCGVTLMADEDSYKITDVFDQKAFDSIGIFSHNWG